VSVDVKRDAELAYSAWTAGEEKDRQSNVVLARRYYDGDHAVPLTDRQKEFLGFQKAGGERFALNFCHTVVSALSERLLVSGFSSSDDALAAWAWQAWQQSRMDGVQMRVHDRTVQDGEHFVIVDWDATQRRAVFVPHPRYTDPTLGGTGFGCKAHYPDGDPDRAMARASKRWTDRGEREGKTETRQRMTLYYPERVEKYVLATGMGEAGWIPFAEEDGGRWPLPWLDSQGRSLGIPVIHFRNNADLRTELWDAIPIQDAINKTLIDILATADSTGFRMLVALGFIPTTDGKPPEEDGSNYLQVHPGCWIATTRLRTEAQVEALEAADLGPMLELLLELIMDLARVTDTPISRFQATRQIAAEGTLKQQEGPLLAKVRSRQTGFGNSWEDALYMARRLANTFGGEGLNEQELLETQWEQAETRDEKAYLEALAIKREKLGVPLEMIWREAGYSQEQIAEMRETDEYQARLAQQAMAIEGLQAMRGGQG
jgi:hypothetical protein